MNTLLVQNPDVLELAEIKAELAKWTTDAPMLQDLRDRMSRGTAALVVGSTKTDGIEGISIVVLPDILGQDVPWVVYFRNDGPRSLTLDMINSTVDFVKQAGYTQFKALNASGRSDKIWLRSFETAGAPQHIGSAYLFNIGDKLDGSNSSGSRGSGNRKESVRRRGRPRKSADSEPVPVDSAKPDDAHRRNKAGIPKSRNNSDRRLGKSARSR